MELATVSVGDVDFAEEMEKGRYSTKKWRRSDQLGEARVFGDSGEQPKRMGEDRERTVRIADGKGKRERSSKSSNVGKRKRKRKKNLEIGVSTKLIVTARIRGNVLLKMSFLHILKI